MRRTIVLQMGSGRETVGRRQVHIGPDPDQGGAREKLNLARKAEALLYAIRNSAMNEKLRLRSEMHKNDLVTLARLDVGTRCWQT
ncbi:hypothetical protein [Paracoccus zhejiangensis]|uniref:hypothetical protein n=1 Tax=Paracoccus zhejiangensis TaxID=1077935 RepID=UPI0012FFF3C6|nr:hypothetical protein [Paracoccus zhejiangensis]